MLSGRAISLFFPKLRNIPFVNVYVKNLHEPDAVKEDTQWQITK